MAMFLCLISRCAALVISTCHHRVQAKGVLAAALVNYLALLGWKAKNSKAQEVFTLAGLVKEFELKDVYKCDSVEDRAKLEWLNRQHMAGALAASEASAMATAGDVLAALQRDCHIECARLLTLDRVRDGMLLAADCASVLGEFVVQLGWLARRADALAAHEMRGKLWPSGSGAQCASTTSWFQHRAAVYVLDVCERLGELASADCTKVCAYCVLSFSPCVRCAGCLHENSGGCDERTQRCKERVRWVDRLCLSDCRRRVMHPLRFALTSGVSNAVSSRVLQMIRGVFSSLELWIAAACVRYCVAGARRERWPSPSGNA